MNKERAVWIILFIMLAVTTANYFFKQGLNKEPQIYSNVTTITGDDTSFESTEAEPLAIIKKATSPFFTKHQARNITQHISVEKNNHAELPYVLYKFNDPLLPLARLLDFRLLDNTFWFSGDTGLVSFDLNTEQWSIFDKDNGLPGDTAYDLDVVDQKLLVEIYNWKENSLSGVGTYQFNNGKYSKLKSSIETAKAGVRLSLTLTGLPGSVNDVLQHNGFNWASFRGKHISREIGFEGGGVAQLTPEGELVKSHTLNDGLSDSYAYTMTAMNDGKLWLSHFKEERGLSVLPPNTSSWESVKTSANDIELGGVRLGNVNEILVIGQQRGLVFYNTESHQAHMITEKMGLPGYIVTGIQTTGNTVWVSAYSYARGGRKQRSTGLIKFEYEDIIRLFAN